jgi:SAM-dependent methyltransferase
MFKNMFKKKADAEVTTEAEVEVAVEDIQVVDSEFVYSEQSEEVEETLSFPVLDQEPDQPEYTQEENQLISTETEMAQSSEPREWDLFTSPEVVGWSSKEEQETLFEAALWLASAPGLSVLDVGCGRADMYPLATQKGLVYKGIDYNPNIINVAQQKYPGVSVETLDVLNIDAGADYDWVVGSGLFNIAIKDPANYAQAVVAKMYDKAKIGVAFNLLTGIPEDIADEDKRSIVVWEPAAWLSYLELTYKKVICRTDYLDGDTTFYILK